MTKTNAISLVGLFLFLGLGLHAQTTISALGTNYTYNFEALGQSSGPIPGGFKAGQSNNHASNGTSTTQAATTFNGTSTGGCYNFGNPQSPTDRALGFLNSGNYGSPTHITYELINNTGGTITELTIRWDYEKYRSGNRQWDWTFFHGAGTTPNIAASSGNQSYPSDGGNTTVYNPVLTTAKTVNLSGLNIADGASYYLRWTLTGNGGSSNGMGLAIDNFLVSAEGNAPVACTAPSTAASHITFSSISATSVDVNWTNGSGDGRVVMMNSASSFTIPTNGTSPSANTVYSGSGLQVIYNGTGSGPITVTGLTPETHYYFRVYEYCSPDRVYNTAANTGNPNFVETLEENTITTIGTYGPFCNANSNTFDVDFTGTGIYSGIYSVQLSDASGSFASPTVIGSGSVSPISAVLLSGTAIGTGYRIRVVNDAPATIGTDNGANISIGAMPSLSLGNDTSYCSGVPFSYTLDAQNVGATYNWNNGQANTQTYQVTGGGIYKVTITDANTCVLTDSVIVTENPLPVVNLPNGIGYCAGSNFSQTLDAGNPGSTYVWTSGIFPVGSSQTYTVTSAGTYGVLVQDANGCIGADLVTVTQNLLPTVNVGNDTSYCAGTPFSKTLNAGNVGATYDWNNGAAFTQTYTIATAGTYSVTVTDANGCQNSDTVVITENALPIVDIGNDTSYCEGTSFSYTLDAGNVGITYDWNNGASSSQTFTVTTAGIYKVLIIDNNACEATDSITVIENSLPIVALGNDTSYCAGTTFSLVLSALHPGATYVWNGGGLTSPSFAVSQAGTYSVVVTDVNGCSNTDTLIVTANPLPQLNLGNDTGYCVGSNFSLVLNAQNAGSAYIWGNGSTTQAITATQAGTYTVTVTDANGCVNSDELIVSEYALPTVNLGNDISTVNSTAVLNAGSGFDSYSWVPTGENTQQITVTQSGTYSVTVTDANGCSATDQIVVNLGTVSIDENIKTEISRSIFPNPSADKLNVHVGNYQGDVTLCIISLSGQVLWTQQVSNYQDGQTLEIDVTTYQNGMYLLQISSKSFTTKDLFVVAK